MRCSGRASCIPGPFLFQLRAPISPASRAFNVATSSLQSAPMLLAACNLLRGRCDRGAAQGGGGGRGHGLTGSTYMYVAVAHNDATLAVDQNAAGADELPIFNASPAKYWNSPFPLLVLPMVRTWLPSLTACSARAQPLSIRTPEWPLAVHCQGTTVCRVGIRTRLSRQAKGKVTAQLSHSQRRTTG
jgi:hypothetical protein